MRSNSRDKRHRAWTRYLLWLDSNKVSSLKLLLVMRSDFTSNYTCKITGKFLKKPSHLSEMEVNSLGNLQSNKYSHHLLTLLITTTVSHLETTPCFQSCHLLPTRIFSNSSLFLDKALINRLESRTKAPWFHLFLGLKCRPILSPKVIM